MKKCMFLLMIVCLLTGCSFQETLETVLDDNAVPVMATTKQLVFSLPEDAAVPSMESDGGMIYLCDDYTLTVQTLDSGDLDRTLRQITGFGKDALLVMETNQNGIKRYECAWTAAGEGEDQVGRAVVLDDGVYHHVVTVMSGYSNIVDLTSEWTHILSSATLVNTD